MALAEDLGLGRPAEDFTGGAGYTDGEYVPLGELAVPIMDFGFLRADACYDTAHVWHGLAFRLDDHIRRFRQSCDALRLDPGLEDAEIREVMVRLGQLDGRREQMIQIVCTRGRTSPEAPRDPRRNRNRFWAFTRPLDAIDSKLPEGARGLNIQISDIPRIPPESFDPRIKTFLRGDLTRAQMEALDAGADTCLVVDMKGNVTEGPGFNVFSVQGDNVATPELGMLEGITRRTVMELAAELGLRPESRAISPDEMRGADEVFISSSAGGIMAVTRIDGTILSNGAPGPVTTRLAELYWAKKSDGWHATPIPGLS